MLETDEGIWYSNCLQQSLLKETIGVWNLFICEQQENRVVICFLYFSKA